MNCIEVKRHQESGHPWRYEDLDRYQRKILEEIQGGRSEGKILLSELAPVITTGRRTPAEDLTAPVGSARVGDFSGVPVYPVDRGGLATYHGPGQWVLFPVLPLKELTGDPRGVRKAIQILLGTALKVGLKHNPTAHLREGAELGVWTEKGKFAAVGIHVVKGVVLHGLSLNGFKTPTSFMGIRPCGLDAPVDFLISSTLEPPEKNERAFLELGQELISTLLLTIDSGKAITGEFFKNHHVGS